MGKWAEVACNCPNRVRLPGGDSSFDRPYRTERHLDAKQQDEVERWQQTRENMFACGHRSGLAVEFWPGNIITLGYHIGTAGGVLEVFAAVGNSMFYDNDEQLLMVSPDEAEAWMREIDQVTQALNGAANLAPEHVERLVEGFVEYEMQLDRRADVPAAPSVYLERAMARIREALADAAELCRASLETGNPIRLLW